VIALYIMRWPVIPWIVRQAHTELDARATLGPLWAEAAAVRTAQPSRLPRLQRLVCDRSRDHSGLRESISSLGARDTDRAALYIWSPHAWSARTDEPAFARLRTLHRQPRRREHVLDTPDFRVVTSCTRSARARPALATAARSRRI